MPGHHVTGIVADASSWTGSMCTTLQRENGDAGLVRVVEHLNGVHDSACKDTGVNLVANLVCVLCVLPCSCAYNQ